MLQSKSTYGLILKTQTPNNFPKNVSNVFSTNTFPLKYECQNVEHHSTRNPFNISLPVGTVNPSKSNHLKQRNDK